MSAMSRFASFLRPWLLGLSGAALTTTAGLTTSALPALAQATPGLMEFRWENNKDYRKLYFFQSETARLKRAEYYLLLRPKDRKTAILKLTITIPATFNTSIEPKRLKFCKMAEGGMLKRTLEGTSRKRKRVSGFRVRMRTHTGRRVVRARRRRGRARLAV